jgi:hypothetical protein
LTAWSGDFVVVIVLLILIKFTLAQDFPVSIKGHASFEPAIAGDSLGNFVVVWTDYRNARGISGGTGSGGGDIYGQRFDSNGIPIGENFRVTDDSLLSDISYASQVFPRVAMNRSGQFVVTWQDNRPGGTPSDPTLASDVNIYAQYYNAKGNKVGSNFLVNDDTSGAQLNPDVIIRDDGSFIIIWEDVRNQKAIFLQSFGTNGERIGNNKHLQLKGERPKIAEFRNGDFVIVVSGRAQIFDRFSNPRQQAFNIFAGFGYDVIVDPHDRIIVTVAGSRQISQNYIDSDVFLECYNTTGLLLYPTIKLNDDNTNFWQSSPVVAAGDSTIFVTWGDHRDGYQIGVGSCRDIYGQRLNGNLSRIGSNFKITHEIDKSAQAFPTVLLHAGKFFVAWLDDRRNELYPTDPPLAKKDIWATIQDFYNPIPGIPIRCTPPKYTPLSFRIFQSYPNPTRSESTLWYDLPEDVEVEICIFDILGRVVKTVARELQTKGQYWKIILYDDFPNGVYFLRMTAIGTSGKIFTGINKIIILK